MDNKPGKLPSFKAFLQSRGKGGTKKGVNLLGALKNAKKNKMAKKESKADIKEDKKDKGADEAKENT